jgi:hypothetical protein
MGDKVFNTKCRNCGAETLYVMSGYFNTIEGMPLYEDGFSFTDAGGIHTEEETVCCYSCGDERPLDEYYI